ncbi:MAG: DUF2284 domain-containing protein [Deltaproteobacteria bacterium]|jgi:predicted metal-binding protein|nr:DUF2284 domain-containing protein [Deltaproteobacteria bacterium]
MHSTKTREELEIFNELVAFGASDASPVPTGQLRFNKVYRKYCAQNLCGNFGKSWTCPPYADPIDSLAREITGYGKGIVFTAAGSLRFAVDWKSMMKVSDALNKICFRIMDDIVPRLGNGTVFGYGPCKYCEKCSFFLDEPCRFPDKKVRSLEGACLDVTGLAELSGLEVKDDPNRITFFGLFVFDL